MVNQVLGCGRIGLDADRDAGDGEGGEGRGRDTRHEQRVLTILRLWVGDGEHVKGTREDRSKFYSAP